MSEFSFGSWELLKVVLNDFAPVPTPHPHKRHLAMFGNFCCCNSEWVVLVIQ